MTTRLVFASLTLASVALAFVACDDDPRYVYTARRFDRAKGCLEDYRGVDTVAGDGVSVRCKETCLTSSESVYVSPVCPPFPENVSELEESAPECQAALDASRMEASCSAAAEDEEAKEEDGGEEDGGGDGDASADAGTSADAAEEG